MRKRFIIVLMCLTILLTAIGLNESFSCLNEPSDAMVGFGVISIGFFFIVEPYILILFWKAYTKNISNNKTKN